MDTALTHACHKGYLKIKMIPRMLLIFCLWFCLMATNADTLSTSAKSAPSTSNDLAGQHIYYYQGEALSQALYLFTRSSGFRLAIANDLASSIKNKPVNGRFVVDNPTQLIQTLANKYGFEWFIYSGTLYITPTQRISRSIEVSPEDMPMVRANLEQIGLLNDKFGYSELRLENKIVISGPRLYVEMLLNQIRNLKIAPSSQQFAVYHLKYASATDIELSFNNQQITIPGVATILQSLLQGNQNTNSAGKNKLVSQIIEPIQNQAKQLLAHTDNSNQPDASKDHNQANNNGTLTTPLIQADSRLNTIIIRDKAYNLNIYRNLIDLLDVPAPLIQVEVMIIHLDQKKLSQAGINWWASAYGAGGGYGAGNLNQGNGPSNNLSYYYGQVNPGQLIVTNLGSFASSLNFLEQNKFARAVGRPSLATTDNLPAIVNVTENLYFNSTGGSSNTNNANNNNLANYTSAQIVQALQITPHLIYDKETSQNQIKLSIVLMDGTVNAQNNTVYPDTTQSTINSQAVINEGQSILLAGYTRDVSQEEVSKVPFLGDIPLLGWFFKSKSTSLHQISTLYLVTPRVVWQNQMHKLKDYVVVDNHKIDIRSNYQLSPTLSQPKPESSILGAKESRVTITNKTNLSESSVISKGKAGG